MNHAPPKCPNCNELLLALPSDGVPRLVCPLCRQHFETHSATHAPPPLAGASMVLGLASFLCSVYTAIPALFVGFAALRAVRSNPTQASRMRFMAWTGIVSAMVSMVATAVIVVLVMVGQISLPPIENVFGPTGSFGVRRAPGTRIGPVVTSTAMAPIPASPGPTKVETVVDVTPVETAIEAPAIDTQGMTALLGPNNSWLWLHPIDGIDPASQLPAFHREFFLLDFDDAGWNKYQGETEQGFGYGDPMDVLFQTPPTGVRFSAYFRCKFNTESTLEHLVLEFTCDDGAIAYLDGVEVGRINVTGDEHYQLRATRVINSTEEVRVRQLPLADPLAPGEHVLAFSLHNANPSTSTDLRLGRIQLWGHSVEKENERSEATPERSN